MWWILIVAVILVVFIIGYVLTRTAGDGRPAVERLHHPDHGGVQEEYGGDGEGRLQRPPRRKSRYLSQR